MSERVTGNTTGPTDAVAGVPTPRRETPSDVPPPTPGLHLAVELDGAGRHPAAWRLTDARDLFTAAHWHRLAAVVDGADLDLLVLPDEFRLTSEHDGEQRGRLDAVAIAANLGSVTARTGLVPVVTTTHTEPFHTNKAVATVDLVSAGRAGWQLGVSRTDGEADAFGRKGSAEPPELWAEAAEAVDVVRLLWDSWEDDAVVRDAATGRYVDRAKIHHIDAEGPHFSVRGPSITPRSPQGQPLVVVPVEDEAALVAVGRADVVRIAAPDLPTAVTSAARVREAAGERSPAVLLDVEVLLRDDVGGARTTLTLLDTWAPGHPARTLRLVGTGADLAALLTEVAATDGLDGVTLVPLDLPVSLRAVADVTVPALRAAGLRPSGTGPAPTLRGRFGLARPASVFATTSRSQP